ncbi:hypothetical protein BHM03_00048883 [Ensete ventricosum]|nr:hypothetical protein BHM03_00048883 [Ensete ventricosum]
MVQRLTYRKRHSYATKSNQTRVVKTPGNDPISPSLFFRLTIGGFFSLVLCSLALSLLGLMWKCRWETCVPVHQQESERTEMPCDWQENSRGKQFLLVRRRKIISFGSGIST